MFRGLLYGSYQKPRELVWLIGMGIYLCLMAEGFFGYLLPWGNMSYWGAQVILNLAGAIPVVGDALVTWVRGDYLIIRRNLKPFLCDSCGGYSLDFSGLGVYALSCFTSCRL
jgi:ubiquinol-cytochrome c reductase cytochrome b subunit